MRAFQFEPLTNPGSEIRLLDILPGSGTIRCRLRTSPLETVKGKYEPLSYCWGDQKHRAIIFIDDCTLSITADLNSALQRLRSEEGTRTLWVDAICINQADISEKNAQVPLMNRIYRCGHRTLVWLGEHDSRTETVFNMIEFIADYARDRPNQDVLSMPKWNEIYLRAQRKHSFAAIVKAKFLPGMQYTSLISKFWSVFGRPWFTRVWIIQEIATSPEALVICGVHQISWDAIERASRVSDEYWHPNTHLHKLIQQRDVYRAAGTNNLDSIFLMASRSEVTNPRDRIYALLGLLPATDETPQVNHGIIIDYEADINEVFRESTKRCLQVTESSRVLAGSTGCLGHELPGLPSWALCPVRRVAADGFILHMPSEGSEKRKDNKV